MTDPLLDRLSRANPIPLRAVELLSAQLRRQSLHLSDRTPRRRRARTVAIPLALAVAALVVAPALALRFGVIDFTSAKPAPPRVVKEFSSLSEGAPAGMDPRVVAGETRLVGEIGGRDLWVAPTASGGLCYEWSEASGGCDSLGTVPLSVSWSGSSLSAGRRPSLYGGVDGFVHARWADDVEIKLHDGSSVRPRVIWISAPIDAGFFSYRAPTGRAIETVLASKGGNVMTADSTGTGAPAGVHPFADLSKQTEVASLQTDDGAATLWTAPTTTEGRCTWLSYGTKDIPVVPCLPKGYEHQAGLALAVHRLGGRGILTGECGYSAVEFLHPDGSTRTVGCRDGLVYTELSTSDTAGELRALDTAGHPLPGSTTPVPQPDLQP
jgi:hypothetical protein